MTTFLRFVLRSAVLLAILLSLALFAGHWHWLPELLTHFRLPTAVGFAVLTALLFVAKLPKSGAIVAVLLVIQCIPLSLHYLPFTKDNRPTTGPELKLMTFNVLTSNNRYADVEALIRQHDPDFLLLQETSSEWIQALSSLRAEYPYQIEHPRSDNFGILLYSKYPFTSSEVDTSKEFATPLVLASVQFQGKSLNLINTHTLPPMSAGTSRSNQATLEKIAEEARNRDAPLIVAGDFNCSAYAPSFRKVGPELRDSSRGRGYAATHRRYHPLLGIPIDQVLYTDELVCTSRQIGPRTGSDHSPIITTFRFAAE
ncbi:endonuclease/exonuclease/phosphatase family protein [Roseibacillus persicicus]|uniref:Endonuclease/exonuclease/phosphatase domain-containing protein n=1 Tax=Roseibacillus persicicus TaxID=454148 RepID=A0A918TJM3_9BACT|nr:endonuclease/exonuclease/phosphatase family protein [Roseibacillus persicicus]GHC49026.1 hypothetical protein GCM10007100_13740 [Roseibacillus persicicus]